MTPGLRAALDTGARCRGKPFVIGLTGSHRHGQKRDGEIVRRRRRAVHDADAAIHQLYGKGGAAVEEIAEAFPGSRQGWGGGPGGLVGAGGGRCRGAGPAGGPGASAGGGRTRGFSAPGRIARRRIVVLDIPLLFETGAEAGIDAVVVASAPASVQRARALARPGMSEEKFEALLARQMPDVEKRANRRIIVVITDKGLDHARDQVQMILAEIREENRADA